MDPYQSKTAGTIALEGWAAGVPAQGVSGPSSAVNSKPAANRIEGVITAPGIITAHII